MPTQITEPIVTTFDLNVDFPFEEIWAFYRGDLISAGRYYGYDAREKLLKDKFAFERKFVYPCGKIKPIEAVVLDRHEAFDWDDSEVDVSSLSTQATNFLHAEALQLLEEHQLIPATRWSTLCFGYQYRDYFEKLKYNPKWLIVLGELTKWEEAELSELKYQLIGDEGAIEILHVLIEAYGPGRICSIQRISEKEKILIPKELGVEGINAFVKSRVHLKIHKASYQNDFCCGSSLCPMAICTDHRGVVMFGYSEPGYPRVLGIREKRA